jgi:hypothetical protein
MDATKLDRLTREVLGILDWSSLKVRYRQSEKQEKSQFHRFSFNPLDYRKIQDWKEIAAVAATLGSVPAIADRVAYLAKAGLRAELHSYEESGFSALVLTVTFDETGRSALEEG